MTKTKRNKRSAEELAFIEQERQELADSHRVLAFEQTGPHTLKITFDDNTVSEVNFMQGLDTIFTGELYAPFRAPEFFKQVFISRVGYLEWPGGFDFNPAHLYRWREMVGEVGAP